MRSRGRSRPVYGLDRRRSVPAWLFWTLASAVAIAAGVGVALMNSGDDTTPRRGAASAPKARDAAPVLAAAQSPSPSPTPALRERTPEPRLASKGVTVQVLNATTDPKSDNRMVRRLRSLGYDVVAVHPASKIYRRTTVFWSHAKDRDASARLADHFSWPVGHKPRNLSGSVTLHVVVGQDEAD
jgi:LytR cell envelope-related transcriptional attenuator